MFKELVLGFSEGAIYGILFGAALWAAAIAAGLVLVGLIFLFL